MKKEFLTNEEKQYIIELRIAFEKRFISTTMTAEQMQGAESVWKWIVEVHEQRKLLNMKIEIELPYEIGTKMYWLYKNKIVHTEIRNYVCFYIGTTNHLKVDMERIDSTLTEVMEMTAVFANKEDLIKSMSNI